MCLWGQPQDAFLPTSYEEKRKNGILGLPQLAWNLLYQPSALIEPTLASWQGQLSIQGRGAMESTLKCWTTNRSLGTPKCVHMNNTSCRGGDAGQSRCHSTKLCVTKLCGPHMP
eukprot:1161669-Pelagomonas_calceolata.AAC.1